MVQGLSRGGKFRSYDIILVRFFVHIEEMFQ